jgi:Chaperone of endosialidase
MTKIRSTPAVAIVLLATLMHLGNAAADQVIPDDLIVQGSTCIGFDCVNNESFGFDTIKLKENNLRIFFEDTSIAAGFPTNNWRLIVNDSASGGANFVAIEDASAARQVFRVDAGASANSIFVSSTGRVGFGTATPVLSTHARNSNTPAHRLEQDAAGGFPPQTWDIAGNEANFFIRDVTGGSRLPFRIRPGAPTSSIDIAADGNVRLGTATSTGQKLDVVGGVTMTGGLHVGNLPTYGSNACRSTLGQTVGGFFSIGDCASDARLKRDIADLPDGALAKILALKPANFIWNADASATVRAGFVAQDTLRHVPEAVGVNQTDGYHTWDSNAVLAYTVKALQELDAKVNAIMSPKAAAWHATGSGRPVAHDFQAIIADLVAVIQQQQRRLEALERAVGR